MKKNCFLMVWILVSILVLSGQAIPAEKGQVETVLVVFPSDKAISHAPFFGRAESDLADLRQAVDQLAHFRPEVVLNIFQGGEGILHRVVEEPGGHACRVQLHLGENAGNLQGMDKIGFSGKTDLTRMDLCGKDIGLLDEVHIRIRIIGQNVVYDIVDP